jgi:hypothetical protein
MPDQWYELAKPGDGLLQGDFVLDCPILDWQPAAPQAEGAGEDEQLKHSYEILKIDVVVMTQACDLEQKHVDEVVVCPLHSLTQVKQAWEANRKAKGQGIGRSAWSNFCDDIKKGFVWNYALLNHGEVEGVKTEHRVVDFHDIYTIPLAFLQGIANSRGPRLRLRPPYREHLSQAFARYFMRVGLPTAVETVW